MKKRFNVGESQPMIFFLGRIAQVETDEDEDDLQFLSARLPGSSFPTTSPLMVATSMADSADSPDSEDSDDDQTFEDKELLKRLKQGQARMEQVNAHVTTRA